MPNDGLEMSDLLSFISPQGQRAMIEFVRTAKETRGENWLPEIKAEFPTFSWIVELIADRTAEEAYAELSATFSNYPLWMAKTELIRLHGRLLAEINKPR